MWILGLLFIFEGIPNFIIDNILNIKCEALNITQSPFIPECVDNKNKNLTYFYIYLLVRIGFLLSLYLLKSMKDHVKLIIFRTREKQ